MWLSPLKGAHLTLGQLDKTLPVDVSVAANKNIERGSIVYIKADNGSGTAIEPRFALYTDVEAAKPNAVPYIALQGVNDFQAGMAGNVGQAETANGIDYAGTKPAATSDEWKFIEPTGRLDKDLPYLGKQDFRGPRITAISLVQPAEYQTTAFEDDGTAYYVGEPLTVSENGKLTHFEAGTNIVGYVTAVPFSRWINDLGASVDGARISGGNKKVINFSTAWIPASGTPAPLAVGAPKVTAAAAADGANKPAQVNTTPANGTNKPAQAK